MVLALGHGARASLAKRPNVATRRAARPAARGLPVLAASSSARGSPAQGPSCAWPRLGHSDRAQAAAAPVAEAPEPEQASPGPASALLKGSIALALALSIGLSAPGDALAAKSGGRMGGRSFSSSPSRSMGSSSSSSSLGPHSLSAPRTHTTVVAPVRTSSFVFLPGMGMGYGMGYGMFNPLGGIMSMMTFAMFAFVLINIFQSFAGGLGGGSGASGVAIGGERVTVLRMQVGLLGLARTLQKDLERIADEADTSTPEGMMYVLEETVLALNRHPDYCVYGNADSYSEQGMDSAEARFNELSIDERGKIEEETFVNVRGRKKQVAMQGPGGEAPAEYILVTLLLAVDGSFKMPPVSNLDELRTALNRLTRVSEDRLQAVEVLWTPQDQNDTLSEDELSRDYPALKLL
mmetsp:Transcript_7705/g.25539  ORF Transcript_7705/g.25539 Transcript_7705/m.25539 type:complete len:407 (-) Transcript_7705:49-1269(-)